MDKSHVRISKPLKSTSVYTKYPADFKFNGKAVLNLGCGFAKFNAANVINLDAYDNCDPQVVWDLAKMPMPFPDESFDFIIANHILEHVPDWWKCFEDCARVLKAGGTMEIWLPGNGSDSQLGYRDHLNLINQCSFWGINGLCRNPGNAWAAQYSVSPANAMALEGMYLNMHNEWWIRYAPKPLKAWMANFLRNTIAEIGFQFRKKGGPDVYAGKNN